ncbi:hypothetical protein BpHYR1_029758 [Brachionus plicatilis]|uniref:Uncharacterized protein n=1 Tax=Brachionus plicatilis TaxID=10195 RepID=A0A3M7PFC5_BRAPC|nr:hypothetical protein BpHYR1_029758 [Brachionus plicatilis]
MIAVQLYLHFVTEEFLFNFTLYVIESKQNIVSSRTGEYMIASISYSRPVYTTLTPSEAVVSNPIDTLPPHT